MSEEQVDGALKYFTLGLGLDRRQQGLLVRVGWVSFVSAHILWVCGWLTWVGLQSPYARADDVKAIQHNIQVSTTINIGREIRDEYLSRCQAKDAQSRQAIDRYIEYLQNEYLQLTNQRYPEPRCDQS